ncbi:hypothetical protein HanHA300_Chr15g0565821 [Helianthus annuus]|nr:hypothetical protein HanHA300_Chr15g0565821 [Helianthus annuus]KAJ0473153.1 hypothetical protein HanHA89_Chr15g0615101 [Helianthus annuus]KAJ0648755.1 hypothetical protein HanLR1_Chr15g0576461 [Helianthus annuus]
MERFLLKLRGKMSRSVITVLIRFYIFLVESQYFAIILNVIKLTIVFYISWSGGTKDLRS